jgi:hypothetical protein
MPALTCCVCRDPIDDGARFVLVRNEKNENYCSEVCLLANVDKRRRATAAVRRRWMMRGLAVLVVLVGAKELWRRVHAPRPVSISYDPPEVRFVPARPEPSYVGPAWPPTDDDWRYAFAHTAWTYPLPGPARRAPSVDEHILGAREPAGRHPPVCHERGRCGVDLGGELWGEHVYAVHDGVVDRVQHADGDERGGVYLRVAHLGGMVFTHYFHLAAVPRSVVRGAQIKAGDVIGLVGDTGNEHRGRYLHFALSVRPSTEFPEVFWDPTPLMTSWPMRLPPHGTVAGYLPRESDLELPPFRRRAR